MSKTCLMDTNENVMIGNPEIPDETINPQTVYLIEGMTMTEHQKFINKAKKVASLLTSPVEGEAAAAAGKLKLMLSEHNLTMAEIGIKDLPAEINNDEIKEVIYKGSLNSWIEDMIMRISMTYGVLVGRYGSSLKLVGFPADLEVVKMLIVNLRKHVEDQIANRGLSGNGAGSYASGYVKRVFGNTYYSKTPKSLKLAEYINKNYGVTAKVEVTHPNFSKDYQTGLSDGSNYRKVAA